MTKEERIKAALDNAKQGAVELGVKLRRVGRLSARLAAVRLRSFATAVDSLGGEEDEEDSVDTPRN